MTTKNEIEVSYRNEVQTINDGVQFRLSYVWWVVKQQGDVVPWHKKTSRNVSCFNVSFKRVISPTVRLVPSIDVVLRDGKRRRPNKNWVCFCPWW